MAEPGDSAGMESEDAPPPRDFGNVELKAKLLLATLAVLVVAFLGYVLYSRGAFEPTQSLVLVAEDVEGLSVGANLTFAGFAIGRVGRIDLAEDGKARIRVDLPKKDAHWLRETSVYTLERSLVGATRLRAFTGDGSAAPLPEGAVRPVLRGDATESIPEIVSSAKAILRNLERMTDEGSDLNASLGNLRGATARMNGQYGVLEGLLGDEAKAKKVIDSIDRANRLLDSLAGLAAKLTATTASADALLGKADQRVFAPGGAMDEGQKALAQLNAALADVRGSLAKADAVLADARKVGANAAAATENLAALRAEVDAAIRRAASLIDEINRKWPFARETEIKLP